MEPRSLHRPDRPGPAAGAAPLLLPPPAAVAAARRRLGPTPTSRCRSQRAPAAARPICRWQKRRPTGRWQLEGPASASSESSRRDCRRCRASNSDSGPGPRLSRGANRKFTANPCGDLAWSRRLWPAAFPVGQTGCGLRQESDSASESTYMAAAGDHDLGTITVTG